MSISKSMIMKSPGGLELEVAIKSQNLSRRAPTFTSPWRLLGAPVSKLVK